MVIINEAEKAFLDRLATRLDITENDYKEFLKIIRVTQ